MRRRDPDQLDHDWQHRYFVLDWDTDTDLVHLKLGRLHGYVVPGRVRCVELDHPSVDQPRDR